jgi:hypothetical protein
MNDMPSRYAHTEQILERRYAIPLGSRMFSKSNSTMYRGYQLLSFAATQN